MQNVELATALSVAEMLPVGGLALLGGPAGDPVSGFDFQALAPKPKAAMMWPAVRTQ